MLSEIAGWLGFALTFSAYVAISLGKIAPRSIVYCLLNISSALLLGYVAYKASIWSVFCMNVVWGGVALVVLIRGKNNG